MIDREQVRARALVAQLHDAAKRAGDGELRHLLEQSALLIDEYQAGHALATPHPLTGMALVHSQLLAHIDIEHITLEEIAA